jgi:hypothetical protein
MNRLDGLQERRAAVIDRWKALTLAVYPERAAEFIVREPDRFRNPVGHLVGENLEILYDGLLADAPAETMRAALDGIVRIRAVQDLSPSAAVGFVFLLKQAVCEELSGGDGDPAAEIEPAGLFDRIDRLALQAFDLFMRCREQIYDLRVREIRGRAPRPHTSLRAREIEGTERSGSEWAGSETKGEGAG